MTNPQQPYHFGFPSSVKAISFPGRPRIVTVEAQGITVNPGNYSYNGEPFSFVGPGGPTGPAGTSSIAPGATGPIGFKKPPATAPKIVQPFSTDMMNRLYSWEQPPNGYVSAGGTVGAGVIFVDFDNLVALAPKAKTIAFEIDTRSHGSSTPPGPPEIIWYICYTELAQSWSPGPLINATQNLATQSFFDYSPYLPPSVDPTNPAQDATFGGQAPSACDFSYQWQYNTAYQSTFGVPCPSGASTQAGAQTVVNNLGTLGLDSSYLQIFPWAIVPPPPPGSAECSWSLLVRSWRRANNFSVALTGKITNVTITGLKGKTFLVKPTKTLTLTSKGNNPKACRNIITVTPASMQFTGVQRFS